MRISVLLVEDDEDFKELVKFSLSRPGAFVQFDLQWKSSLAGALEYLSTSRVDLIIADLGLPDTEGHATVEKLAAVAAETPFIVLSAEHRDAVMWEVISSGAEDRLIKTDLNPDLLTVAIVNAIARYLEHRLDHTTQKKCLKSPV